MNLVSFKSQGQQQKLLTAVFEVNEKAEPFQIYWKAAREHDGHKDYGDGADLLIR